MHVLAIVAHADDESLFCGGILLRLRTACKITIAVTVHPRYCNRLDDRQQNETRAANRLRAFDRVCGILEARPYVSNHDRQEPLDWPVIGAALTCDLILTHGASGEYGHPDHVFVSKEVSQLGSNAEIWHFACDGPAVPIDLQRKRKLLACYQFGCTRTRCWRPQDNPTFAPWTRPVECVRRAA